MKPNLSIKSVLMFGAVLALSSCAASTPLRYHALAEGGEQSGASSSGDARMLVEISPISLPDRVDRQEIVVNGADGRVEILEFDRWAGSISNELRLILDQTLWSHLSAMDVYQAPLTAETAGDRPYYRLNIRIVRFDAIAGDQAIVEGAWTARRLDSKKLAICRFSAAKPLAGQGGADEIASALRLGSQAFANAVAASIERLQNGERDPCANLVSEASASRPFTAASAEHLAGDAKAKNELPWPFNLL